MVVQPGVEVNPVPNAASAEADWRDAQAVEESDADTEVLRGFRFGQAAHSGAMKRGLVHRRRLQISVERVCLPDAGGLNALRSASAGWSVVNRHLAVVTRFIPVPMSTIRGIRSAVLTHDRHVTVSRIAHHDEALPEDRRRIDVDGAASVRRPRPGEGEPA